MARNSWLGVLAMTLPAAGAMAADGAGGGAPAQDRLLEEVNVYGSGYRTTGTKSRLMPFEAPMSFEIYDSELLELRQVDSVNEALRYVSGITPENRSTVTIFDQYTIRGFESYRNYYDGLPLQYNGLWNLVPQVDAFATASIEILKGPTSVLYGSAPPGGMVNQTAKQPRGQAETLVRTRLGSASLRELAVDTTGPAGDSVNYRLIALARQQDGQQRTTEQERLTFAPSVTWQAGSDTSLNLNLYYQNDPEMIPSTPLPALGTRYGASYGRLDADAYAGDANWAKFEREVTMLGYKFNHAFSDSVSFLQNFRYTDADALQNNTYNRGLAADGRTLLRNAYLTDEEISGLVVDNQLALTLQHRGVAHNVLVGLEYQTLDSDIRYRDTFGAGTPAIDLASPDHRQINRRTLPIDTYRQSNDIEQTQLGIYLQDEIRWQALTVVAGLRHDSYESTDAADFAGAPARTEIDQDELTARAAAIYTLAGGVAPYVSYSESFEPTSGVDSLTGAAFEPTTARQIEAGFKYRSAGADLLITAAYFDLRKENVVVNTPDFMQFTQNGEVQSQGGELSVSGSIGEKLDITANFTHMDVSVTDNPLDPALVGRTPVWVAEKQASLWADYFVSTALRVSGGVRYIGESQIDAQNTDTVPSYTLFDLALSYAFNDSYRLGFTVSNLGDKDYVGACSDVDNCWLGAERSVELNLNAAF